MIELAIRYWRIGLAGAVAICFGLLLLQNYKLKADYNEEKALTASLRASVERQNAWVEQYEARLEEQKVIAEKAKREAREKEIVYVNRAQKILVEVPTDSDECVAALELLRKYQ